MLRRANEMRDFDIAGQDGNIGKVHDFYFDDQVWIIRYLVADTGPWLFGRKILLSPEATIALDRSSGRVETNLTQDEVEDSPKMELNKPVSRQLETKLHDYFAWPYYWIPTPAAIPGSEAAGMTRAAPIMKTAAEQTATSTAKAEVDEAIENAQDPNLRSIREVTSYTIHASDGEIGSLTDFFVDEDDWTIRYLLVDTGGWLSGRQVLISPDWLDRISWPKRNIYVHVSRDTVESSPEYKPSEMVDRPYEELLFGHFGFPGYWLKTG